jgi:Sortilin, neurotensin receptor 3,/BNR/Asp-box repeat
VKLILRIFYLYVVLLLVNSCQKETSNSSHGSNHLTDTSQTLKWEYLGRPLGDSEILTITIHPQNDNLWFVTSENGIYVTRDGGKSWERYFSGYSAALEIDRNNPSNIYASTGQDLYLSTDQGKTWSLKYTFPKAIISILASTIDNAVYVGIAWEDSPMPNGIYKSTNGGNTWQYYSYNVTAKGLIPWDIEEDAKNNKIYIATEIYNHPQPYHPPFLRSSDGGKTWKDISGTLTWHAVRIQVHPTTHYVYALLEGPGLYYSKDFGDTWNHLQVPFWLDFIIDKKDPDNFFGGALVFNQTNDGGIYRSNDQGQSFLFGGLEGHSVGSLCLDNECTSLYVASYNSGIYRAR